MSGTVEAVELPTEEEYDRAEEALSRAFAEVEQLAWRLSKLSPHVVEHEKYLVSAPSRPATAADVGLLWSFLDGIRLQQRQLADRAALLQRALTDLDDARLQGRAAAKAGQ